jgi:hypothetical protein
VADRALLRGLLRWKARDSHSAQEGRPQREPPPPS